MRGVILYGPPAAGKDAVTVALSAIHSTYWHFPRLKVGPGRPAGYRPVALDRVAELRARGEVLWENSQYGALYVIDRPYLHAHLPYCVPVVHLGQVEAVTAILTGMPEASWTVAYLWCPRAVAEQRLHDRGTDDVAERLSVWDAAPPLTGPDVLRIDTATGTPADAARLIHSHAVRILTSP